MNSGSAIGVELDLPPEYCHYRDEGCELADSCLNCPLPQCIYDQPGGKQHWLKAFRDGLKRLGRRQRIRAQQFFTE